MGRLKKDHSGYKTSGLWTKYSYPKIDEQPKVKRKKDTSRWCRGKFGVEHEYELIDRIKIWHTWETHKCANCGKKTTSLLK